MGFEAPKFQVLSQESQALSPRELERIRELQKKYTESWVWRTLGSLIELDAMESSAIALAKKLEAPLEEVVTAIEGLEELGILKRERGRFVKSEAITYISDTELTNSQLVRSHVLVSSQLNNRLMAENLSEESFVRTLFIATNKNAAKKFFNKLDNIMREFLAESEFQPKDSVYGLALSSVRIAKTEGEIQ